MEPCCSCHCLNILPSQPRASECKNGFKSNPQVSSEDKPMLKLTVRFLEWELLAAESFTKWTKTCSLALPTKILVPWIEVRQMVDETNRNRIWNSSTVRVARWHSRGGHVGWTVMGLSAFKSLSELEHAAITLLSGITSFPSLCLSNEWN